MNKISGYAFEFLMSIVLARGLGDYGYGLYSEILNLVFLFSLFCSLGLDTALNVHLAKFSDNSSAISSLLRRTFLIIFLESAFVIIIVFSGAGTLSRLIHSPELVVAIKIAAFYMALHNLLQITQMIFITFYATKLVFITNSILKFISIISAFVLLKTGYGLEQILLAFTGISLVIVAVYFRKLIPYMKPKRSRIDFGRYLKFGLVTWVTKFINYLLGRYFDIFLLGYWAVSKKEIGYYNIAFSITLAMFYFFSSGFGGVATAAFANFEKNQNRSSIALGWNKVTKVCIFFSLPVFLYVILNAQFIITFIYSQAFAGSVLLFQVFASFFLISVVLGSGINSSVLYSIKKERTVLWLRAAMGTINVVLDLILIPKYRALGAIVATGFSTALIISLEYAFVRWNIKQIQFPVLFFIKILIATIIALLISCFVSILTLFSLLLNGSLFLLVFFGALYFMKPLEADDRKRLSAINSSVGKIARKF